VALPLFFSAGAIKKLEKALSNVKSSPSRPELA
jgi:hypothetical protein